MEKMKQQPGESWKPAYPQTKLLNLPRDVMIVIFIKLGVMDLLLNAQRVCSSWRRMAKDPQLYRVIHIIKDTDTPQTAFELVEAVTIEAIKRSHGQLVEFSMEHFCTNRILETLIHNSPMLKRFRLTGCFRFSYIFLIEVFPYLRMLEEVEFLGCFCPADVIQAVCHSCPNLKLFRSNTAADMLELPCDNVTFAMVGNMNPGLRTLDIPENILTDAGLKVLLERFTQLEYLGIRVIHHLDNFDFNEDWLTKFDGIKVWRYRVRR